MILSYNPLTLLLDAGHGEYVPASSKLLFSAYDKFADDFTEEDAESALRQALPPGAEEFTLLDPGWCQAITISGSMKHLEGAFSDLRQQVSAVPSGDDDTFDYWPSGCRLLIELAIDLDALAEARRWPSRRVEALWAIKDVLRLKEDSGPELAEKIGLEL